MTEATQNIESLYVKEEGRVLDPTLLDHTFLERMPNPTGWRILILPYRGKGTTDGGIHLPDKTIEEGQIQTVVAYVLKQGSLVYRDKAKYPAGAWCKEKDWIVIARYAGSRLRIEGGEVRIINDDEVLATILDPDDIINF